MPDRSRLVEVISDRVPDAVRDRLQNLDTEPLRDLGTKRRPSLETNRIVPDFFRKRYVTKFVSAILVVVVLISAVGAYGVSEARSTVAADTQEHLEATAQHQANSVGAWIRTKKLQTRIASERESIGGDPTNVKTDFQGLIRQYGGGVVAIHYVDTKRGTVTTSTGQLTNRSLDEIDAPWVDAIRSEKMGSPREVWMSDVAYQGLEVTDKVVAFVSIDFSRRYAIVLVARYEVKMQQMNEASKNQTTNILNSNAEPVLADASWGTPGDAELRQSISKRADENTAFIKGDERVYAFTKVPGTDMVTVTSKPTSDAFQVARTVSDLVIWIVGISLFGLIVVGVVLGRHTAVPLVALRNKVHRMEEGDLSVELSTGRIDEIGQLYLGFANMRDSLRDQIQTAQEARAEAQAAQAETEEMNRHLEEKAREYRNVMTAVGEGDLTRRMDPESRNEAMEDIATSFNEMIASLERTTHELSQFAVDVAAGGEEVMASTEEIKSASERVTESVQEISAGAGTQHEKLRAVFEETNELSTTIEEVASSANQVASLSEQTAETGADARKAAEAAVSEMQEIEHEADETVAAIERLQDQMEQIEEITEFITQVAEQTNILALNANIEAARAGDAGEGFAVVAEEVKSLAEETQQAAEEIEQLVDDIQAYTETTAEEVEETSDVVERSTESVQRVIDALEEIAGYAEETNTGVQEISTATEQQASSTNEVVGMVEAATEISETTDAESENVAAAAEEQTSSLSEVAESVNDLAQQADELSDALGRFDTRPEPEGGKPGDVTTTDGRSIDDRTDDDRTSGQDLDEQADVGTEAHPNND